MITTTRNMKARRDLGPCGLCRQLMTTGQRVCRVGRGGSWLHVQCFMRRFRPAITNERTT